MNELIKKRIKIIAFFGTMGVISFTLMAKPVLQTVKAYLNPSISYTLDGKKVLEEINTLTYDNKTYVPLADIGVLMGLQAKFENNTVIMSTVPRTTDGAYTVAPKDTETVIIPTEKIKEIKVKNKAIAQDVEEDQKVYTFSKDVKILEVNNSGKYILIETEGGPSKVVFDNKTKVNYENTKKNPNINALKVNQIVDIKFAMSARSTSESHYKILEITVKDK